MALSIVRLLKKHGTISQDLLAQYFAHSYDYDRAYGPAMHRILERIRQGESWQIVSTSAFEGQGSWGNGAAMRVAPLGAYFAEDLGQLVYEAQASAEITHAHPEAIAGAIAVAVAAALVVRYQHNQSTLNSIEYLASIADHVPDSEVRTKLIRAQTIAKSSYQSAVHLLGHGLGMSAMDTVPFALWCVAHYGQDYEQALWAAVSSGGDKDTLGAIVGGISALYVGQIGLPSTWLNYREPLPAF
jgi:ADP-ribosylglycohydrolase